MSLKFSKFNSILLFSADSGHEVDPNFYKFAGADIDGSCLVVSKKEIVMVTSPMNVKQAQAECKCKVMVSAPGKLADTLNKVLPKGKIGLDFEKISAGRYLRIKKLFGNRIVDATLEVDEARMVKTKTEIAKMKKAARIAKKILAGLKLKPNMTELDVVAILAQKCLENRVKFAYPPIVAAGKNSSHPHHTAGKTKLGHGIVLIDFGVKYGNYCSDLTRCFFLGKAVEERKKYSECQAVFARIIKRLPQAKVAGDIAKIANEEVANAGWPPLIHAVGHGLGLEVHEAPHLHIKSKEKLSYGVSMAIEPGWYDAKKFGVRYENDIIFTKKNIIVL